VVIDLKAKKEEPKEEVKKEAKEEIKVLTSEEIIALQKKVFIEHLEMAKAMKLGVIVHERMAFEDTLHILKNYTKDLKFVVINCFTGSESQMKGYLSLGDNVYIVLTGIVANEDRGKSLQEVVSKMPIERLLLGTDAPYLLPFSMGKPFPRFNEPQFLPHILSVVAKLYKKSSHEIAYIITQNAKKIIQSSNCFV